MDFLDSVWMFLQIILLDIALGGDNSIIIGMAAKGLPPKQQKRVIFWGAAGAILARFLLAAVLVWLLMIPYLKTAGGLVLLWIGMKLIGDQGDQGDKGKVHVNAQGGFLTAVKTVIIADAIMSLDNVLALVAVTEGQLLPLVIGMLISVPIIIAGSAIIINIMERYPSVIYIGSIIIGWAAGGMVATDTYLGISPVYSIWIKIIATVIVALGGWFWNKSKIKKQIIE